MTVLAAAALAGAVATLAAASPAGDRAVRACAGGDLRPLGGMLQGATGSMVGTLSFRNVSSSRCRVGGRPAVQVFTRAGALLPTRERPISLAEVGGRPRPVAAAGGRIALYLAWSNWCGPWPGGVATLRQLVLRLTLTTGVRLSAPFRAGRPRCDVRARSTIAVSPFRTEA